MKNKEYIDVHNKAAIDAARGILSELILEDNDCIEIDEYRELMNSLYHWSQLLSHTLITVQIKETT